MRAPEQEAAATAALSYVEGDFRSIGWAPLPNGFHDLGTDLYIQVRDARRFDRKLIVGAQVKGGPSWFEQPYRHQDESIAGWWYYEPTADHFDDWVTHGLPHVLVLHDLDTHVSYWVHVTAERCEGTGKGCKIRVPVDQTIDAAHLDALLDVAASQRAAGSFEQRAFHARAALAPPARRLRYALLTPRLIAPHGNTGYERRPEPEEYLALLVGRRSHQTFHFEKAFPETLGSTILVSSLDWRWRFAHALKIWLDEDDLAGLRSALATTPGPTQRSCAAAVVAAACFERGDFDEAKSILSDAIANDDASPVDLAWLLVHRAMILTEVGDVATARADAARATQVLKGDEDDPTAALIAGVAAHLLFATAGFGSGDLEKVINSNDTAAAWWRAQTLSWALSHFDDRAFDEWVSDDRLQINLGDDGWENLEASRLNALLVADLQAWRSINARHGKHLLRFAHGEHDDLRLLQALDQLRRSGEGDALARALGVVWQTGPVSVLREAAELAGPETLSRSTAAASFKLWGAAADALTEDHASELASWCLTMLSDNDALKDFSERFASTLHVQSYALDTLRDLLPVASPQVKAKTAQLVLTIPDESNLAQSWARIVLILDASAVETVDRDVFRAKAESTRDHLLKAAILRRLAIAGDEAARSSLIARSEHDLAGLEHIPGRETFDLDLVQRLHAVLEASLERVREEAAEGRFGIGGVDAARLVAHLNVLHPASANWSALRLFLTDPRVAADHKEGALNVIAAFYDELGAADHLLIQEILPSLLSARFLGFNTSKRHPEAALLLETLINPSNDGQEAAVAALLSGEPWQRSVATRLLGRSVAPRLTGALYPLLADENLRVRSNAAFAWGRLVRREPPPPSVWTPAIARIVNDDGALMPSALLSGLSEKPFAGPPAVIESVRGLATHDSFAVRCAARDFLASAPISS